MVVLPAPARLRDLVQAYGGSAPACCLDCLIHRVSAPEEATTVDALVPVLRRAVVREAQRHAGIWLVTPTLASQLPAERCWRHEHAPWVMARLLAMPSAPALLVAPRAAFIESGAQVAASARIETGCIVRAGATVGEGCHLEPNVMLLPGVTLGARVSVGYGSVLGRAGFGWVRDPYGKSIHMPHRGGVVVEDDVSLGAYVTVDAGVLSPTRLGRSARIDSHVHLAHNVVVGEGAFVAAQAGFAGSAQIGARVLVGGQAGVADHVRVGDDARIAAQAGVIGNVPARATVVGYPAMPRWRWLRGVARAFAKK